MKGALDGLRVVDFGQHVAGPLLGTLLADAAAIIERLGLSDHWAELTSTGAVVDVAPA